jgi:hypothetical protein
MLPGANKPSPGSIHIIEQGSRMKRLVSLSAGMGQLVQFKKKAGFYHEKN